MTNPPAESTSPLLPRIPTQHVVPFLHFCLTIPDSGPNEIDRLVRAIIDTLEGDPENDLAWAALTAMGVDDLSQSGVARLYATWAAARLLEQR